MSKASTNSAVLFTPLAAIALIGAGIFFMTQKERKNFFAVGGDPIGRVASADGQVLLRPDVVEVWRDLKQGDEVRDSDRLTTEKGSKLKIKLTGNVTIELEEYSQIWVRSLLSGESVREYDIELLRGTMVVTNPKECDNGRACEPVIVKSGGTSLNVEAGNKLGYFKQVGEWPQKFDPGGKWPTLDRPTFAAIETPSEEPEPTAEPVVDTTPQPVTPDPVERNDQETEEDVTARGFEPSLVVPATFQNLVSLQSPATLASEKIVVTVNPPARKPPSGTWTPVVDVLDAAGNARGGAGRIVGQPRFASQSMAIPVSRVFAVAGGGNVQYFLRPGVIVKKGRDEKFSAGTNSGSMRISVIGAGSGSTLVGFDRVTPARSSSPWLVGKAVVNPGSTPIQVLLRYGNDYSRLVPFLNGSTQIGVAAQSFDTSDGVFLVRSGTVIAKVIGAAAANRAIVAGLISALGCEFAFRGSGGALVPIGADIDGAVGRLKSLVEQGKSIYIFNGSSVEFISGTFIQTSSDLSSFLRSQAKAVFTQQVQLIR